jgi:predicted  nucleic acid-binding Zn-ribbon protein
MKVTREEIPVLLHEIEPSPKVWTRLLADAGNTATALKNFVNNESVEVTLADVATILDEAGEEFSLDEKIKETVLKNVKRRIMPSQFYQLYAQHHGRRYPIPENERYCSGCNRFKELNANNFHRDGKKTDGRTKWRSQCKSCRKKLRTDKGSSHRRSPSSVVMHDCSICGTTLPYTSTYFNYNKGKLRKDCKTCTGKQFKRWYDRKKRGRPSDTDESEPIAERSPQRPRTSPPPPSEDSFAQWCIDKKLVFNPSDSEKLVDHLHQVGIEAPEHMVDFTNEELEILGLTKAQALRVKKALEG